MDKANQFWGRREDKGGDFFRNSEQHLPRQLTYMWMSCLCLGVLPQRINLHNPKLGLMTAIKGIPKQLTTSNELCGP